MQKSFIFSSRDIWKHFGRYGEQFNVTFAYAVQIRHSARPMSSSAQIPYESFPTSSGDTAPTAHESSPTPSAEAASIPHVLSNSSADTAPTPHESISTPSADAESIPHESCPIKKPNQQMQA
ncbi:hypothetical protein PoB_005554900 [Plakobranchus ocellatus]|uniref:Uncharacterized protein n=1 Tax=Plakobranchus ocellatus TaxID=259542 RepID=A0AAV4C900_9GAST|nr:hypothetical protein PoB_005554900 [Plakobranchus ocellatus]